MANNRKDYNRQIISDGPIPNTPVEVENAYRRGFAHGAYEALQALQNGKALRDLLYWFAGPVLAWRAETRRCHPGQVVTNPNAPPGVE